MYLDISTTEKLFGQSCSVDLKEDFDLLSHLGKQFRFDSGVSFKGFYTPKKGYIEVTGMLETRIKTTCDKCLIDAYFDFNCNFFETFQRDAVIDGESDIYTFSGANIVLDVSLMDNVIINLPLYSYCKPDCMGLCISCGVDLNKETCRCKEENLKASSPFAALGDLFDNDKEV